MSSNNSNNELEKSGSRRRRSSGTSYDEWVRVALTARQRARRARTPSTRLGSSVRSAVQRKLAQTKQLVADGRSRRRRTSSRRSLFQPTDDLQAPAPSAAAFGVAQTQRSTTLAELGNSSSSGGANNLTQNESMVNHYDDDNDEMMNVDTTFCLDDNDNEYVPFPNNNNTAIATTVPVLSPDGEPTSYRCNSPLEVTQNNGPTATFIRNGSISTIVDSMVNHSFGTTVAQVSSSDCAAPTENTAFAHVVVEKEEQGQESLPNTNDNHVVPAAVTFGTQLSHWTHHVFFGGQNDESDMDVAVGGVASSRVTGTGDDNDDDGDDDMDSMQLEDDFGDMWRSWMVTVASAAVVGWMLVARVPLVTTLWTTSNADWNATLVEHAWFGTTTTLTHDVELVTSGPVWQQHQ